MSEGRGDEGSEGLPKKRQRREEELGSTGLPSEAKEGERWKKTEKERFQKEETKVWAQKESYELPEDGDKKKTEGRDPKSSFERKELLSVQPEQEEIPLNMLSAEVTEKRKAEVSEDKEAEGRSFCLPDLGGSCTGAAATVLCDNFSNICSTEQQAKEADISGMGRVTPEKKEVSAGSCSELLGSIFSWLDMKADVFKERLCKTLPSGRLFPLPTSPGLLAKMFPQSSQLCRSMLSVLVKSLNSLNGEGQGGKSDCSEFQGVVLTGLMEDCFRVSRWNCDAAPPDWNEFLRVRGVDYKGDEVLTAQTMQWENVAPALPQEVGKVALEDVVELGCKHYVLNFEEYLLEPEDQAPFKPPKVMVPPSEWGAFCSHLLERGIFSKIHEDDLPRVHGQLLLNGLFGVSKHEFDGPWEILRIIMNLIPLNGICREFEGDVATLPAWSGMTPLQLQPHEDLLVSSEDVRCFFYIFRVPEPWHRFLAFNRPLPKELAGPREGTWYPCSSVLPMGFKNSVSLAQHVHRFIVKRSLNSSVQQSGEAELRKDKPFSVSNPLYRIYLDNFDELEKTSKDFTSSLKGTVSPLVQGLREQYSLLGVPRHPKKAVSRSLQAEVQGALVDGQLGIAQPKVEKVLKYMYLTRLLLQQEVCTQKQAQIVGGGLVYMAMFRRPLLGGLNHLWQFILSFEGFPPVVKFPLPPEVKEELARFLGLIPLAYMDFRCNLSPVVTASDASTTGGGITASVGITPLGGVASQCTVRGDLIEPADLPCVLTIGLFDGIGALRVAADALGWSVMGHISVEKSAQASRVVESHFPNTLFVNSVEEVDAQVVKEWSQKFTQVSLIILGAGPPCQGVSGLNAARKGALRDQRSCLFSHVSRIRLLVKQFFPWAQVKALMESVASMDLTDQGVMSADFGIDPWSIDASGCSAAHRPRLYWIEWEIPPGVDYHFDKTPSGRDVIHLDHSVDVPRFLEPGWHKTSQHKFPTFTTSRPREQPGYKPAGIKQCSLHELRRWKADEHRFPPYQYQTQYCVSDKHGTLRLPSIIEREAIMGFPKNFTMQCMPKQQQGSTAHNDCRLSLVGNSWNVTVVAWLLSHLGETLGLNEHFSVGDVCERTSPGCSKDLQTYLTRPSMQSVRKAVSRDPLKLVQKLLTLVSVKGEDIMLQHSSEDLVKYHRLRASIPADLWKWTTVASWQWTGQAEHINALELRAVLTSLRWRLERHKKVHCKFVHLIDSMVCLHALSRGRSSSRKLRRTMLRINALLLATKSQGVWTYVHTKQNPADAPSRRPQKRKWLRCQKTSRSHRPRRKSQTTSAIR